MRSRCAASFRAATRKHAALHKNRKFAEKMSAAASVFIGTFWALCGATGEIIDQLESGRFRPSRHRGAEVFKPTRCSGGSVGHKRPTTTTSADPEMKEKSVKVGSCRLILAAVSAAVNRPANVTLTSNNMDLVLRWDPPEGAAAGVLYTTRLR